MRCPSCGKDSSNRYVCGYCHTPYPTEGGAKGGSQRTSQVLASQDARGAVERRALTIRWSIAGGVVAIILAYLLLSGREKPIPVGVVLPNLITAPMSAQEAGSILKTVNATSKLEERGDQLFITVAAAQFPEQRAGQLAMAQQYTRADEIVLGRKRSIAFVDPGGATFAIADPAKGVVLTR